MTAIIRPPKESDLRRLAEIYNHYVCNTPATFDTVPFSVEERREWFEEHSKGGPHRLFVAELDHIIVGYASSSRFRPKPAYATSVETSVYLDTGVTGRGLGTALYLALFEALISEDVHRAYAGITLPNPLSIALHTKFGFRSVGVFREVGRKFHRYWDVQWFERSLPLESASAIITDLGKRAQPL